MICQQRGDMGGGGLKIYRQEWAFQLGTGEVLHRALLLAVFKQLCVNMCPKLPDVATPKKQQP